MDARLEVRSGICTALTFGMQLLFSALTVAQTARPTPTPTPTEQPLPHVASTEIVVRAPRMDIPLKENPAATTVVQGEALATLPKTIGAEEALKLVPGVKVDNQADGERVHMSIRGQGILTERGIRGIKVLLDGLPLNDPTGFAPDLFDVDWDDRKAHRGVPRARLRALRRWWLGGHPQHRDARRRSRPGGRQRFGERRFERFLEGAGRGRRDGRVA